MMVQRRHLEQSLPMGQLEIANLQDHAHRHAEWDDGNDRQQSPLPGHQGHHRQGGSKGKRTGITHEELRRMHVEPQKTEQRPNQGEAEAGQEGLPLDQCDPTVGRKSRGRDQACQPIQAVCQVDSVGETDDQERCDGYVPDAYGDLAFDARQVQIGDLEEIAQTVGRYQGKNHLEDEFCACPHPYSSSAAAQPFPIVHRTQQGIDHQNAHRQDHRAAREVETDQGARIQKHGDQHNRQDDHHAPHGWGAQFCKVPFGSFYTDRLADFEIAQNP